MSLPAMLDVFQDVLNRFDQADIPYMVVGSLSAIVYGEGYAKLFETSALSVSVLYRTVWTKNRIDLAELASKRWGEKWSLEQLTKHFGYGRTAVVRKIGQIKKNPDLILDGRIRSMIKSRKYRFMGKRKGSDD